MMIFAWIQGVFPFIAIGGSFCCTKKELIKNNFQLKNFGIDLEIDSKVDFSLMMSSVTRKAELQSVGSEYLL